MKHIIVIITVVLCLNLKALPVATTDDFQAPFYNPAALSFGNAAGFAYIDKYDEDGRTGHYYLVFNSDNSSFVYGKFAGGNTYKISLSQKLFRNMYLGSDIDWLNSNIGDANYGVSLLARPLNSISLGTNIRNINRSNPEYILGVGFKPPGFTKTNRLILTSDITYSANHSEPNDDYKVIKNKIGLETNLVDGIYLGGSYDIENETFGLNFSLSNRGLRIGNRMDFDDKNEFKSGSYYINFSQRDYPALPFIPERDRFHELSLKQNIVEEQEQMKLGPFSIVRDQQTIKDLISTINKLKDDDRISGIVLKNPRFSTSYANIEQLERTITNFKDAGKSVIVYSEFYGNLHYAFLASIADELYLNPNGSVMLQGFSVNVPYFNKLLDRLGIDVYDLKSHDYKTGFNMFTETEMTEYERETYATLLDVYFDEMAAMIDRGRNNKITRLAVALINEGPYLNSQEALELGLVDKLIYEDELGDVLKDLYSKPVVSKRLPNKKIDTEWAKEAEQKVALIYAVGNIIQGEGRPGNTIGSKTLSKQIRKARKDSSVKGIILRIDSGGGSAFASDLIAREVKLCREAGKPVVVSMAGAAASGGYYIAAYADKIVAENTTITGSIGVTGFLPNFHRLFDKIHINWDNVKKGDNADLLSSYREYEEEEVNMLREYISLNYDRFVNTVAEGREKDYDDIHHIAQGRVWSGYDAKELGLIDETGGLDTSIELMKEITGINNITLVDYSYSYRRIPITLSADELISTSSLSGIPFFGILYDKYLEYFETFDEEYIQYKMRPFEVDGVR